MPGVVKTHPIDRITQFVEFAAHGDVVSLSENSLDFLIEAMEERVRYMEHVLSFIHPAKLREAQDRLAGYRVALDDLKKEAVNKDKAQKTRKVMVECLICRRSWEAQKVGNNIFGVGTRPCACSHTSLSETN